MVRRFTSTVGGVLVLRLSSFIREVNEFSMKGRFMRFKIVYFIIALLTANIGCVHITGSKASRGTETFEALQKAVAKASEQIKQSVVYIVPLASDVNDDDSYQQNSFMRRSQQRNRPITGIIMTKSGYILMPGVLKPDSVERLTVWVGDAEYQAGVVKADDQLDMTIIKINADDGLVPLSRENLSDLETGAWCVSVRQSGEEMDFKYFTSPGFCRGVVDGRYRSFFVNDAFKNDNGAPVVALDGSLVGITADDNVLSITDLNEDLQDFLNTATGVTSPEDEARSRGWLGVMLQAVNKDYAKEHELPRSGIWVTHAVSNGPAAKAGIRTGDLIIALNGSPIRLSGARAQSYFLQSLRPQVGREFEITVVRNGKNIVCRGTFEKAPEDKKLRARDIGVEVKSITEVDAFSQNLFSSEGVLVTDVEPGSAAATSSTFRSGLLRKGDVILELDGKPTPTLDEFKKVLDELRRAKPDVLLVYYQRGRYTGYAGLNLKIGDNGNGGAH